MRITLAVLVLVLSSCAQVADVGAGPSGKRDETVPRTARKSVPPGPPADFTPKQVSYAGEGAQ